MAAAFAVLYFLVVSVCCAKMRGGRYGLDHFCGAGGNGYDVVSMSLLHNKQFSTAQYCPLSFCNGIKPATFITFIMLAEKLKKHSGDFSPLAKAREDQRKLKTGYRQERTFGMSYGFRCCKIGQYCTV